MSPTKLTLNLVRVGVKPAPKITSLMSLEDSPEKNFLSRAIEASRASSDPSSQVGAVTFVNNKWHSTCNSLCPGSPDEWYHERELKYPHIVHAEENLIARLGALLWGEIVAVTHFPCQPCAKLLSAARVGQVIALRQEDYETRWADSVRGAQDIFNRAGIPYRVYERK